MSKFTYIFKALIIGFISLLLLIVLSMIRSTILERQSYRSQAIETVQRGYAGTLKFAGPVLIVPFQDIETIKSKDEKGVEITYTETKDKYWISYPTNLDASGAMVPSIKKLGIHEVRVFEWNSKMKATFDFNMTDSANPMIKRIMGTPYLSIVMNDTRGLMGNPKLSVSGKSMLISQGAGNHGFAAESKGVHVDLAEFTLGQPQKFSVDLDFLLGGTETLSFVPMADSNNISIESAWPHPNFGAQFSPRTPTINAKGFKANWNISSLSASSQSQYRSKTSLEQMDSLEVNLIDPVDIYLKADRASKYAFLFIGLTFVGFLMFEIIKQLAIHPIQYGLVGMSLAIFFLLLISLSEHFNFLFSYTVASVACIGLLFVYLSSVLKSYIRGLGFSGMLTMLYAALYGLLVSEDNSLVMGSIMLFGILAAVMLVTRKIDWYNIGKKEIPQVQ